MRHTKNSQHFISLCWYNTVYWDVQLSLWYVPHRCNFSLSLSYSFILTLFLTASICQPLFSPACRPCELLPHSYVSSQPPPNPNPLPPSPTPPLCPSDHYFHFTHFAISPPARFSLVSQASLSPCASCEGSIYSIWASAHASSLFWSAHGHSPLVVTVCLR